MQTESFFAHHGVAHVSAPRPERAHPRLRASELPGLKTIRIKYGQDVDVIDLSAGGVRFETTFPLTSIPHSENARVFVTPAAILHVRFL